MGTRNPGITSPFVNISGNENTGPSVTSAILFDFGQTLADSSEGFRTAEKEAQEKLAQRLAPLPRDNFLSVYRSCRKAFQDRSDFSRPAMWAAVCRNFGVEPEKILLDAMESDYWKTVEAQTVLFPETARILAGLTPRYRLALITNTQGEIGTVKHRIECFPALKDVFSVTIVAGGESGVPSKPDPIPFRLCLERLGMTPREALFVGDDWRIDICGALNVGIQPIWIRHRLVQRTWPAADRPVPTIESLDRLLDVEELLRSWEEEALQP